MTKTVFCGFCCYNLHMETKNKIPDLVQCRKTGKWYNPVIEFEKVLNSEWFKKIMINLKNR